LAKQSNEGRRFADWLRRQLEEYQLTPGEAAKRLDLASIVVQRWLSGHVEFPSLPKDDKGKIRDLWGEFPESGEVALPCNQEFRPGTPTLDIEYIRDLDLSLKEDVAKLDNVEAPGQQPKRAVDHIPDDSHTEYWCKCGAPVPLKCEGRCPSCQKRADGSQ
jgi:hypothetical protein